MQNNYNTSHLPNAQNSNTYIQPTGNNNPPSGNNNPPSGNNNKPSGNNNKPSGNNAQGGNGEPQANENKSPKNPFSLNFTAQIEIIAQLTANKNSYYTDSFKILNATLYSGNIPINRGVLLLIFAKYSINSDDKTY